MEILDYFGTLIFRYMGKSLLLAFLCTCIYVYMAGRLGWNRLSFFRSDSHFRYVFSYICYTAFVLLCTILDRTYESRPLAVWMKDWVFTGNVSHDCRIIGNFLMLIPYTFLLFSSVGEGLCKKLSAREIVEKALLYAFLFSLLIETSQLVFHIGTFQISDLVYNTIGGGIGGFLYFLGSRMGRKIPEKN